MQEDGVRINYQVLIIIADLRYSMPGPVNENDYENIISVSIDIFLFSH